MKRRLAALVALCLAAGGCDAAPAPPKHKPDLYLITSLPLLFGEGFGLGFAKADVVAVLERDFTIKPLDLPSQVPAGAALLMAQPRALPAEELVALDKWVRGGGKLVLLADPMLEWPSERPIGDRLRPPIAFADTGLLQHWGLRLDAPDARGLLKVSGGSAEVALLTPGRLVKKSGTCKVANDATLATCALGRGEAVIIADADFIDAPRVEKLDPTATGGGDWLGGQITSIAVVPPTE